MRGERDGCGGVEGGELPPEEERVGDEEGVGVDEDGAGDAWGQELVDEELHEAGWGVVS